jgi:hypothetical protein
MSDLTLLVIIVHSIISKIEKEVLLNVSNLNLSKKYGCI